MTSRQLFGRRDQMPSSFAPTLGRLCSSAGVVGAADPDRAERHAVWADAAAALGARDTRLAIRVPVAPEHVVVRTRCHPV